jgi:ATP-dependent helicase/nuclease subunit B
MSLRFIIGRAGTGKTTFMLNEIREKLEKQPAGPPILYIVPEQMTFLSEQELVHTPGLAGMIRAQVYSFTRLAWRIFGEAGGASRNHLTSAGLNMLIRKIVEDNRNDLKLFRQAADKSGFIKQMEQMFTEFKQYCVQPDDVAKQREEMVFFHSSRALADKLHDIELIYRLFEKGLEGKYLDSNDYLRLLSDLIERSDYLRDAEIYIDGFYSFTPQEYLVIGQLMKKCARVSVALVLDRPFRGELPDELHLFGMAGETYARLYDMALQEGVQAERDVMLKDARKFKAPGLRHLEAAFERRPVSASEEKTGIRFMAAANRRAEMEGIAREIRRLVMEEGYRYRDIAVLVRNGDEYRPALETIFQDYEIPFFIDQKRSMLNHPLVELIRSVLEVANGNWRYEPVFRAIKTDLLFPLGEETDALREQMDRLENYVLAYGKKGDDWTKNERWAYSRFRGLESSSFIQTDKEKEMEREIARSRDMVAVPIARLSRRLKKAETGQDLCEALYLFLEELEIPKKLEKLSEQAEAEGRLIAAREHGQAWNAVMGLLDEFVEILGDARIPLETFISILDSGLEEMKFSLIPPAMDQIFVADLEKSRLSRLKAAFVAGLNDGVLPLKVTGGGVLSDEDRTALLQAGFPIAPDSKKRLLNEEFVAYRAFTAAEELLVLSYPLADEEGKALQPSPYIERLRAMFPRAGMKMAVNEPAELFEEQQLEYISHPDSAIAYLTAQLQLKKKKYPTADFWWDVYNFYMASPSWKRKARRILSSLYFQNATKKLSEETSKKLYGENIITSVSRVELFQSCPFSHFATYGLKLREREIYRLEAPHVGDLFHSALKWIADRINESNMSWSELTKEQCGRLAKEAVAYLAPKLKNEILLSTNRHSYMKRKLEKVIERASYVMSGHAKKSGFSPVGLELAFGPGQPLPPLSFTLKDGTRMELQGRIDRVDKAENENGIYVRVIDYKSSARQLDLSEVYYGLSLQVLTYLDIIVTHSKKLIGSSAFPAGVFYFHLHNPIVESNKIMTLEDIEEEINKKFKMDGLVLEDPGVIRLMDKTLESGNSQIITAGIKTDGTIRSDSKAASKDDFRRLRNHVRSLYKRSGNAILSGYVDISPYQMASKTPCQFCLYKPVCQFDEAMSSNRFRIIQKEKREQIMERIREEGETI